MKKRSFWVVTLMAITLLSSLSLWAGQGDWTIQTVDLGTHLVSSLALDSEDHPHISYYSLGNGSLCYASESGGV
jgi:hypothetical protein